VDSVSPHPMKLKEPGQQLILHSANRLLFLNLGCLHSVACVRSRWREFIPSMQRYYRRLFTIYYYLNCYMFRSYDHLQAEIYLPGFTLLTTDPCFFFLVLYFAMKGLTERQTNVYVRGDVCVALVIHGKRKSTGNEPPNLDCWHHKTHVNYTKYIG
jgi:hypothetical protein